MSVNTILQMDFSVLIVFRQANTIRGSLLQELFHTISQSDKL